MLLLTGARCSEVTRREVADLDLKTGTLTIGEGKTDASRRTLPLNPLARAILEKAASRFGLTMPDLDTVLDVARPRHGDRVVDRQRCAALAAETELQRRARAAELAHRGRGAAAGEQTGEFASGNRHRRSPYRSVWKAGDAPTM